MSERNETTTDGADIVVTGYSPRFRAEVDKLLRREGGFVDHKADTGGATNYGISLRFLVKEGMIDTDANSFADFDFDMDGDIDGADVRKLTRDDAIALYHRCFWKRIDADRFPRPLGEMIFDQAVNGGQVAAIKLLQRALNTLWMQYGGPYKRAALVVDGQLGPKTRDAIGWVLRVPAAGMAALVAGYREAVRERYREIVRRNPSQKVFLKGWLARAEELGR